jgi:hypothetical protein
LAADLREKGVAAITEQSIKPLNLFGNPLGNGVTVAYLVLG